MNKRTILVIDDSEIAREAARAALEEAGYTVVTLPSPIGAGSVISATRPALILLDVGMPSMSGPRFLELASRDDFFRDFFEGAPVVLYSEKPEEELQGLARRLGAAGHLRKGLPEGELLRRIGEWVEAARR